MLYLGTPEELELSSTPDLKIEDVGANRQGVTRWFTHPAVYFVGAHTGCSCGFPSVTAEVPIDFFEGMALHSDDRAADLRSVRALLALIGRLVTRSSSVELYPVADGDESKPPKGVIDVEMSAVDSERFFFNEQFMHVVRQRES
jgi:hypothetical protein